MAKPAPQTFDDSSYPPSSYRWAVLSIMMVALFMVVLDGNIVNVALPHMMAAFATNTDKIRWVVEAYAISYAIFTLTTTWLREEIGIKYTVVVGIAVFTVSSILCGMAWNIESMIVFRIIQGIGGGIMMPTGFTMITEAFPPRQRGAAFGVFGLVIVVAPSIGPTFGGYLVDSVNWRYVFYINLPIGIAVLLLTLAFMKELKKLRPIKFDIVGFISLSVFLGTLLVALTEGQSKGWNSDLILSLFGASAAGFIAFIIAAKRARNPLLNIALFQNFFFVMLSTLNLLRSIALFGRVFLLPLFFQNLIGYSATVSGLLLAPGAIVAGLVMPISGALLDRYGPKFFLFSGFIIFAASNFMFYNLNVTTPYVAILIPMILYGIGAGFLNAPITATAMNVVHREHIGQVSTVLSVLMQVGGAFGVALLGTITNNRAAFHQAVYAENINQYGYAVQSALSGFKMLGTRIGESQQLAEAQAPGILSSLVSKQSVIAGYQDAFVVTGFICLLALIPCIALLKMKHQKHAGPPPAAAE